MSHLDSAVETEGLPPETSLAKRRRRGAFSLIEICIALGIVAFAFVAMLGLLPVGLANYSQAMNTQTCAEIYQRISAELQETDFDTLLDNKAEQGGTSTMFFRLGYRFFDNEGTELRNASFSDPRVIYAVRIRGSFPGKANPSAHTAGYFTSLPALNGLRFNPRDMMFFSVQVCMSRNKDLSGMVDGPSFLIKPERAAKDGVPMRTYSLAVVRNGYLK